MTDIEQIMRTAPVIPVIVVEDLAHAVPLDEALVAGGLAVLEARKPRAATTAPRWQGTAFNPLPVRGASESRGKSDYLPNGSGTPRCRYTLIRCTAVLRDSHPFR
jgi:hypothetical protein